MTTEDRPRWGTAQHPHAAHPTHNQTRLKRWLGAAMVVAALTSGCTSETGGIIPPLPPQPPTPYPAAISKQADIGFERALAAMAEVDQRGKWDDTSCREVATAFSKTAQRLEADATAIEKERDNPSPAKVDSKEPPLTRDKANELIAHKRSAALHAHYNNGVVLERCGLREQSIAAFQKLLHEHPKYHQARYQLARYTAERNDDASVRKAMGELNQAIKDASFSNADALVLLAKLQMQRARKKSPSERGEALDKARKNLQRALAVQDDHLGAYNQLALNYLQRARIRQRDSGRRDVATLEMATLICSQAIARKPSFAPLHNTAGIIAAERGDPGMAARAFNKARKLDPTLFEAHMNFAAVNLQFRGFKQARAAYEVALKQQPKSYDAMVGLALALRGMASDQAGDPLIAKARKLLHAARKLDARRPESYLNEAILILEYEARYTTGKAAKQAMSRARTLLSTFMDRSGKLPRYADARRRAQGRLDDIEALSRFEQPPTARP